MDNAKLKTLVDQQSVSPNAAALGMAPVNEEDLGDEEGEDIEAEPSDGDPVGRGNELISEWGEFGVTLSEEAKELHDLAHDVGAELLLENIPDDAVKAVGKAVDRMPDELSMGFAKYIGELSPDDCEAVAHALVTQIDEDEADVNLLCAFILKAGEYAKEEIEVDEDFNEPEEEEEEEVEEGPADEDEDAPPEDSAPPEDEPVA